MVIEKDFVSVKRAGRQRQRSRVKVVGMDDSNRRLSSQSLSLDKSEIPPNAHEPGMELHRARSFGILWDIGQRPKGTSPDPFACRGVAVPPGRESGSRFAWRDHRRRVRDST